MKKRLQGIIAGLLAGVMLTGGIAYAKDISEKAQIYFRNIKIFIDGGEIVPKGSDGSVVEPFIMNGATYLPVRAVAEALGKDVAWDGKTSTVYIGKKDQLQPDNYLDRIQYNSYREADGGSSFYVLNGKVTDYLNTEYRSGILFGIKGWGNYMGEDQVNVQIDYPLNSLYKTLSGKIVLPQDIESIGIEKSDINKGTTDVTVYFYADGEIIKSVNNVNITMPFSFDVDVRGVNMLTIGVKSNEYYDSFVALTDLALYE